MTPEMERHLLTQQNDIIDKLVRIETRLMKLATALNISVVKERDDGRQATNGDHPTNHGGTRVGH